MTTQRRPAGVQPRPRVGLFIDGDISGCKQWPSILEAAETCGDVVQVLLFLEPGRDKGKAEAEVIRKLGITCVSVPRRLGGTGDPCDLAMSMGATRLYTQRKVDQIALAVDDNDFLYLAKRLQHWGCIVTLLSCRQSRFRAWADIGVSRLAYGSASKTPTMKAVLHPSGESTMEPLTPCDRDALDQSPAKSFSPLRETLHRLRYMHSANDPWIPAFAKFAHANDLRSWVTFPGPLAMREALRLHSCCNPRLCRPSMGDLIYVSPAKSKSQMTKTQLERYGTAQCYSIAKAGGPFVLWDGEDVVQRVLSRLGFLGGDLDLELELELEEALQAFCETNAPVLTSLQVPWRSVSGLRAREALVRAALLSTEGRGTWRALGSDQRVRQMCVKAGLLPAEGGEGDGNGNGHRGEEAKGPGQNQRQQQVYEAMRALMKREGLPPRKSFVGCLHALSKHVNAGDPSLRK